MKDGIFGLDGCGERGQGVPQTHDCGVVQNWAHGENRFGEEAGILMESGPAAGVVFPEARESRRDNAGKVVPVVASRRRIVRHQAQSRRFGPEVASTTAGRDRVESGRPD